MKIKNNKNLFELEEYESGLSFDNSKKNLNISFNRVAFIFFIFFGIAIIFSIKSIYLGSLKKNVIKNILNEKNFRSSILDRNGNIIAKTVFTTNVGIDPKLVKDKKKLLLKLQYTFAEKNFSEIKKKIYGDKFFYIEKKLTPEKFQQVKLLGEKSIRLEPKITRIYPDKNLFSHVVGQIDDDNNGISGIEKSFDEKLKDGSRYF